ncbi:MFS transporter [Paenibacillus sp. OAS669]|uniref:MFS transporter n=1 Tax=Paenibacillus sp. OAS669 TaxID=2663821 RepID=UPI00178A6472|nr:MFS transporter [Paenibacillus sp. OAS669]MBE1446982.1 DHA2 family metal-tetracycline-proton antiporter-like MFS transporter [Paenibacillus sp. OAS669]
MNHKVTIPVWALGNFLVVMNTTMFNVSLPDIIGQLHITAGQGSWIVSGYSIVFALSTIIFSRLSDFIPIRKLWTIGISLLVIASVIGLFADSFGLVLLARLFQASGAGATPGLGMVLASRYVPYERRGRAISMIASGSALAFGLGPVIGGAITQYFGWHELFAVTCLVILLVPILWRLIPKETLERVRFDYTGAALIVITSSAFLIAVTQLSGIVLILSIIALGLTVWHLRRAEKPFIPPVLFQNAAYRKLLCIAFFVFVMNLSMLFLMPLIYSKVFSMGAASIGLMIFPGAFLSACLLKLVGRWIDRYGNYRFMVAGHVLLGISIMMISLWVHASAFVTLAAYLIFSPSLSSITSALSNEVSRILPKHLIGSGMGLTQLSQYLGGSFAVAGCGIFLVWQNNTAPAEAYQHLYFILFIILLISLGMLVLYKKSGKAAKQAAAVANDKQAIQG